MPALTARSGRSLARELARSWETTLSRPGLPDEVRYRIEKMLNRLPPLLDSVYFRTVKAGDMLGECREKTAAVERCLETGTESVYRDITELEKKFEDLLKQTYEFRVKAG